LGSYYDLSQTDPVYFDHPVNRLAVENDLAGLRYLLSTQEVDPIQIMMAISKALMKGHLRVVRFLADYVPDSIPERKPCPGAG